MLSGLGHFTQLSAQRTAASSQSSKDESTPVDAIPEKLRILLIDIRNHSNTPRVDSLTLLAQLNHAQYMRIVNAAEEGATLAQLKEYMNATNDHPFITRLVNDAENNHPNIQTIRKTVYLEELVASQKNAASRSANPAEFDEKRYSQIAAAATAGASYQELCAVVGVDSSHILARLVTDATQNHAHVKLVKQAHYAQAIAKIGDSLHEKINSLSDTNKFFNPDNASKSELRTEIETLEEKLLDNVHKFYQVGGDIDAVLLQGHASIPFGTALKLKTRIAREMEFERLLGSMVPLAQQLSTLDAANKIKLVKDVTAFTTLGGKLEEVFNLETRHELTKLCAGIDDLIAQQKDILNLRQFPS